MRERETQPNKQTIGFREFLGILVDEPIAVSAVKMVREIGTYVKKKVTGLAKRDK